MKRQLCQLLEVLLLACTLLPAISLAHSGTPGDPPMMLQGTILDAESGDPISGARVELLSQGQVLYSGTLGEFYLPIPDSGSLEIQVKSLGYGTMVLTLDEQTDVTSAIQITLRPKGLQMEDITITDQLQPLESIHKVSTVDLAVRPVQSSQEILEIIPGLFIAQHAGGGKAEQMFLRGFDLDHGTDIALTVDGMPVNMVSHAHGHGYSDLHFVIPETIDRVEFDKGMYRADQGNFNTAGSASFQTKTSLEESLVKLEAGQFNTFRGVVMADLLPDSSAHHAWIATELMVSDGYFDAAQDFQRINVLGKYAGMIGQRNLLRVSLSTFQSDWNASGQIPVRAVESGLISRFGAIDSTEGGNTSRSNLNVRVSHYLRDGSTIEQQAYLTKYDFSLFSNFTFFLEDPENGDQIHQLESRNLVGYQNAWNKSYQLGQVRFHSSAGSSIRLDRIGENFLYQTTNRTIVRNKLADGDITELNAGAFASQQITIGQFQANLGLRYDWFRFSYFNELEAGSGRETISKGILSPKLSLAYDLGQKLRVYGKAGSGFHSNDTRVITANQSNQILPRALGADIGFIAKPTDRLILEAAAWTLFLEQEFVYVGDAGIVEPGGRTQRMGIDLSARAQILSWLFADLDGSFTLAESIDEPEDAQYIPLAPWLTLSGGLNATWNQLTGSLRARHLADRPANEDYSLIAEGYTLIDGSISWEKGPLTISLTVDNLLNEAWKEAQFETESLLPGEAEPVSEIHFTPGTPRAARVGLAIRF